MAERVCVVMPTYNELENLHPTVGGIFACRPSVEILIVDDGSPDGTGEEADRMAAEDPRIHVLHRAEKNQPIWPALRGRWSVASTWFARWTWTARTGLRIFRNYWKRSRWRGRAMTLLRNRATGNRLIAIVGLRPVPYRIW